MPFPIRTLFKLIVGRPSFIATWFRSNISLANTGKYRPYKSNKKKAGQTFDNELKIKQRQTPYDSPERWNGLPENPLNVSKKIEIKAWTFLAASSVVSTVSP